MSDNFVVIYIALIGQEKVFKIQFLTNEKVTSQHTYGIEKSANKTKLITSNTDIIKTEMRLQYDFSYTTSIVKFNPQLPHTLNLELNKQAVHGPISERV